MDIIKTVAQMKTQSAKLRGQGKSIGVVPTMGCLHEGHLSLVRKSVEESDVTVVTIFVNPLQFGEGEDLDSYPRVFETDCALCENENVDIVFSPSNEEIYPARFETCVSVKELQNHLCGMSRPGHFDGVTTVVLKLFNIVNPHRAYFGMKDYQQLQIIKKMTEDLNLDVSIVEMPIVRESDGLAMSSRNKYLTDEERQTALIVPRVVDEAEKLIREGRKEIMEIIGELSSMVGQEEGAEVDYIALCDPDTLHYIENPQSRILIAVAIKVGSARLIDNRVIQIAYN